VSGQYLEGFKDLGTTDAAGEVAAPPLRLGVGHPAQDQAAGNSIVVRLGLGAKRRIYSSRGTTTLTVMAMGRRVNH